MTINELCKEAHQRAKDAGWWEVGKSKTPLEAHMLMVSEIAEATEAVRNNEPSFWVGVPGYNAHVEQLPVESLTQFNELTEQFKEVLKPEGEAVELADVMIRIADWAGKNGWDMEAIIKAKMVYNATRGYRHGGKAA